VKRKAFRYALLVSVFVLILFSVAAFALAHSGGTDSEGGHNSPDGYHYHHGYPPHQHPNGECPYDFDDNVDHRERSGDDSVDIPKEKTFLGWSSVTWFAILIFIGILVISFVIPSLLAVWAGSDTKSVGCICWMIFSILLLVYVSYYADYFSRL